MSFADRECVSIVKNYYETMLYASVQNVFEIEFPGKSVPNKSAMLQLMMKLEETSNMCNLGYRHDLPVLTIDIYKEPRCPTSYTTHVKIRSGS